MYNDYSKGKGLTTMIMYYFYQGHYYYSDKQGLHQIATEQFLCMENQYMILGYEKEISHGLISFYKPSEIMKHFVDQKIANLLRQIG